MVLSIIDCYDIRPAGYDTSAAPYCSWNCQEWAQKGYCNDKWNVWPCTTSSEMIKNHCKVSCDNCGKYLINL